MHRMKVDTVVSALNSKTRREMMRILVKHPMKANEVHEELNRRGYAIKYRGSVHRGLQKLTDAFLVEKFYDAKRGMCYRIATRSIVIDFGSGTVNAPSQASVSST